MRWLVLAVLVAGCGAGTSPLECSAPDADGLLVGVCPNAAARLLPEVRIDGTWRGGGRDGECTGELGSVSCPAGSGEVVAELDGAEVSVRFEASEPVTVEGLALAGPARVEGVTGWISNGFQSWSQSGAIGIGDAPEEGALEAALMERGDREVLRRGTELSWEQTVVGSEDGPALVVGALTADRLRPWVEVHRHPDDADYLEIRLGCGAAGEQVALAAGEALAGERFRVETGDDAGALLAAYGDALPSRRRSAPADAEAGWNSWYELWDGVDETAVRDNAALVRDVLGPRLPSGTRLRVVVDDGWQVRWGEWEPNDKFPSGLDGLAADLKADGFAMGVWLAPLLVAEDSALVTEHPDWFVDGAVYEHPRNGPMRVLDVTSPEAAAHLAEVIARIVSWGYDLLKIDFLFAGTFEGARAEPVTGMEAYHRALSIIREAAGEDTLLLAVGSPGVASLPHVDAWRVGGDIALQPFGPGWPFIVNQARTIGARAALCRATLCDADPPLLRVLPEEEVGAGGWVVALGGGALFLSDDLRTLPMERRSWGLDESRVSFALGGEPAVPEPFFPPAPPERLVSAIEQTVSPASQPQDAPRRWLLPDGRHLALNPGDEPMDVDGTTVPPHAARLLD